LIAAGIAPNPFPYADIVTAGTTKTMCGPHSGFIMCKKELQEQIEKSVYPGHVASPHLQTIAAMAYTLKRSQTKEFRELMRQVVCNAQHFCEKVMEKGFDVFTGGTDCHMLLLDVKPFGIDGERFANALNKAGITVNSKSIPFENTDKPGGIRLGTTVLTQRGMKEQQMEEVAELFYLMAKEKCSNAVIESVTKRAVELAKAFPHCS
jgi:glycine hydroxymethyltransferase